MTLTRLREIVRKYWPIQPSPEYMAMLEFAVMRANARCKECKSRNFQHEEDVFWCRDCEYTWFVSEIR